MEGVVVEDMFAALGPVAVRRIFGGKGIDHQGLIIAVEVNDALWLKGDPVSAADFEAAGLKRWTYPGKAGKTANMPYGSLSNEAFDEPDATAIGRDALTNPHVAQRSNGPALKSKTRMTWARGPERLPPSRFGLVGPSPGAVSGSRPPAALLSGRNWRIRPLRDLRRRETHA
jgi:DNA transformation protein